MGISQRQFAKREGCARSLVQRKIQSGHLKALPDGTLDEALIGTPWRRSNEPGDIAPAGGDSIPPRWESEAVRAHYDAALMQLKWEREVERVVLVEDVATVIRTQFITARRRLEAIGGSISDRLVGVSSAPEAREIIYTECCAALQVLSDDGHKRVDPADLALPQRRQWEESRLG